MFTTPLTTMTTFVTTGDSMTAMSSNSPTYRL